MPDLQRACSRPGSYTKPCSRCLSIAGFDTLVPPLCMLGALCPFSGVGHDLVCLVHSLTHVRWHPCISCY